MFPFLSDLHEGIMRRVKPVPGLLALAAVLAAGSALARQDETAARAPQAQEERAGNAAQQSQRKPGEQPVKGQPQGTADDALRSQASRSGQAPPPRRRVPANIATMPPPAAPQAYGPVLHDREPRTTMPTAAGLPDPAPINNCMGGQCRDTSGNTYNTGVGNAAISSDGRLCNRVGNTIQCF
jgi:hypothetical protein